MTLVPQGIPHNFHVHLPPQVGVVMAQSNEKQKCWMSAAIDWGEGEGMMGREGGAQIGHKNG
eukprot:746958-Hanusia_phi.AAC.2